MIKNLRIGLKQFKFIMGSISRNFVIENKQSTKTPSDHLILMLKKERKYEKERYSEFIESKELLKQSGFTLVELPDSSEIKLVKKLDNKIVEIRYYSNELSNNADDTEIRDENDKKYLETRFQAEFIIIVKNDDGSGILFKCKTMHSNLTIMNVGYNKDIEKLVKSNEDEIATMYFGPSFENLEENIQNSFFEYLKVLGINKKLLSYIEYSSVDKDQRLYINWMQGMTEFIAE